MANDNQKRILACPRGTKSLKLLHIRRSGGDIDENSDAFISVYETTLEDSDEDDESYEDKESDEDEELDEEEESDQDDDAMVTHDDENTESRFWPASFWRWACPTATGSFDSIAPANNLFSNAPTWPTNASEYHVAKAVDAFARWAFSDNGIPSLQVLAYGDFSFDGRFASKNVILCRSDRNTANGNDEVLAHRRIRADDFGAMELVAENMDFLEACPAKRIFEKEPPDDSEGYRPVFRDIWNY